jgi:hypothetical protein
VPAPPSFDRSRAPRVGGTSGVTVERFVLPGGLGRITTGIPSKLREALGLVPDTLRPTSRATDEIAPLTGGPAPGTGPVPDTFTTGREGPGDTGIVTGGEGSWAPIPGVRAPVTVLVTNDSTGVTTRASWPSALAKRSQDGTQVRVYETGDATGATGARATVRAEEFCALNPGHPLCAGGATGGNGTSAGGTGAGSSRGSSSGIGTGAKVALGLLGVFLVVRALRARE